MSETYTQSTLPGQGRLDPNHPDYPGNNPALDPAAGPNQQPQPVWPPTGEMIVERRWPTPPPAETPAEPEPEAPVAAVPAPRTPEPAPGVLAVLPPESTLGATAEETAPPLTATNDEELASKLRLQVADMSHGVVTSARDYAAERNNQRVESAEGGKVKQFLRRIWHGNIKKDYNNLVDQQQGRSQIMEQGNIHALHGGSLEDHARTAAAVVEHVSNNEYLKHDETQRDVSEIANGKELETSLKDLVARFADPDLNMDVDALVEEKNRLLKKFGESLTKADRDKGLLLADNVVEVARNAKAAVEHGLGIERIKAALNATSAQHAEVRMGARTELRLNVAEKAANWLYKHKPGTFVNETTLAVGVAIVAGAAKYATRRAVSTAGRAVAFGAGSALVAGVRESFHIKQDRQAHMREMATGGDEQLAMAGKRRRQLEETRYNTVTAQSLLDSLSSAQESAGRDSAGLKSALDALVHARTRVSFSDEKKVDLIQYSSKIAQRVEDTQLDKSIAETRRAVQQALIEADDATLAALGITTRDVGALLDQRSVAVLEAINGDITARDRVFRKLQAKSVLKTASIAFVTSETVALASQEIQAALSESTQGVFEHDNGQQHRTLLASLFRHNGSGTPEPAADTSPDSGYHLVAHGSDYQLVDGGNNVVQDHLGYDSDGYLNQASQEALKSHGITFSESAQQVVVHTTAVHETGPLPPATYIHDHPDQFTTVHRDLWYDNDTAKFDKNELKLDWGGEHGTGVDAHGNYVYNIAGMRPDGSYHGNMSANELQLLKEGKLSMQLSVTNGTQSHVILVKFDQHGQAIIDKNSFAGKNLFTTHNGHAQFHGAYAEVVEDRGTQNGVEHVRVLATDVGRHDVHTLTGQTNEVTTQTFEKPVYEFKPVAEGRPGPDVLVPVGVPIVARRGLESAPAQPNPQRPPYYYAGYMNSYGSYGGYGNSYRPSSTPYAPELITNPDAVLDAEVIYGRYMDSRAPKYRDLLKEMGGQLEGQPRAANPKVAVLIPAAAHQEGHNIYTTLSQYVGQQDVNTDDFEVIVFANYPRGTTPDQTIAEIERFQRDHPDMPVRLLQRELAPEEANIGWIRKVATDTILREYETRGVDLNGVMLVSNDADSQWINPKYIRTIIDRAEAQPDTDAFLGFIDWGHDAYNARPEMLVATRLMQMMEIHGRVAGGMVLSSGANFAVRPSMYMAVGGYDTDTSLGEDSALGAAIRGARRGALDRKPIAFLGKNSAINTSARRALDKLARDGGAPISQWDDGFSPYDTLRNRDFGLTPFNYDDPEAVAQMVQTSERLINETLSHYEFITQPNRPAHERLTHVDGEMIRQMNRMFWVLGVKVEWQPDATVKITDSSQLVSNLRRWQTTRRQS